MSGKIFVIKPTMPEFQEYVDEIKDIWDSRLLTNMGVKHQELEQKLSQYLGVPNITLYTNGHLALENIIQALGLTGEVITTPFTFASTTHAITRCGLTPVFCDINPDDYTMNVNKIESLITDKTSAILPVHVYGNMCDTKGIEAIANKYSLKVIYDAAHAFGIKINGVSSAAFGDASMFSFHATKVFHTIEGGAIIYKNKELKPVLEGLRNYGITDQKTVEYTGGNGKMTEFQASMGLCNLRHLDKEINKRKAVFEQYHKNLSGIPGVKLNRIPAQIASNYAYYPVLFDGYRYSRDEICDKLKQQDIYARKYFYPLTSQFNCYIGKLSPGKTPVAEYVSERILTLPLYADMELNEVDRICEIIKS